MTFEAQPKTAKLHVTLMSSAATVQSAQLEELQIRNLGSAGMYHPTCRFSPRRILGRRPRGRKVGIMPETSLPGVGRC